MNQGLAREYVARVCEVRGCAHPRTTEGLLLCAASFLAEEKGGP